MILHGTADSPASYCNCCLIDTWSAWSWRWLAIATSPLPPEKISGAGYDASRTASHRDLPGTPSLQHLHLWLAKHRLQKVCICWRSSNHTCWWRLAGSGRGVEQGHGNRRLNTSRLGNWSSALQKRCRQSSILTSTKLNVSWKSTSKTKPCPSAPSPNTSEYVGQVAHVPPTPWVTSQEVDITRRAPEAACCLRLRCWSNNFAKSHPGPDAFNRRVLRSCLVLQCLHSLYRPHHQRHLANRDWMPASYTSGQPSSSRRHPTCWASSQRNHTVQHAVPWRLDTCSTQHSLVHPVQTHGVSNRDTHSYPPRNNSLVYLTTTAYVRRSGRITNGMRSGRTVPQAAFSSPAPANTPPERPSQEEPGSGLTASAAVSGVSAPVCTNGVWLPLRPVSVAQKNKPSITTFSWTARPDGSGRWDYRMAAQHLPRDLVRPTSD